MAAAPLVTEVEVVPHQRNMQYKENRYTPVAPASTFWGSSAWLSRLSDRPVRRIQQRQTNNAQHILTDIRNTSIGNSQYILRGRPLFGHGALLRLCGLCTGTSSPPQARFVFQLVAYWSSRKQAPAKRRGWDICEAVHPARRRRDFFSSTDDLLGPAQTSSRQASRGGNIG